MAHEYKPRDYLYAAPFDPGRCKASVTERGHWRPHQCRRKPWKDGWCKQHHPDAEAERREQSKKRWEEKFRQDPLVKAKEEITRLKARIGELEAGEDELAEVLDAILDVLTGHWYSYTRLAGNIEEAEAEAQKLLDRAYAASARYQKEIAGVRAT